MPSSTPNTTGSEDPTHVPYGAWNSFPSKPFEEYEGSTSVFYRSNDGRVVAGSVQETGQGELRWPEDQFMYVTSGSITLEIQQGESFTLKVGDVTFLKKGQTIKFSMSRDFANVVVFLADDKVVSL